jgi:hypothetical protein
VDVYAKVPCKVALEHPKLVAFAAGATLKASAVTAPIVKVRAMPHFFAFINCLHSGGDHSDRLFSFPLVQAESGGQSGHVL